MTTTKYQKWYQTNRDREVARAAENKKKMKEANRAKLVEYFQTHPCVDCEEDDLIVLEFDHLSDKIDTVMRLVNSSYSWKRILSEIEKCEVVCANCHKRRTYKRCNSWRVNITPV
jgi:hypothetical protein